MQPLKTKSTGFWRSTTASRTRNRTSSSTTTSNTAWACLPIRQAARMILT